MVACVPESDGLERPDVGSDAGVRFTDGGFTDGGIVEPGRLEVELVGEPWAVNTFVVIGEQSGDLLTFAPIAPDGVFGIQRSELSTVLLVSISDDGFDRCASVIGFDSVTPQDRVTFRTPEIRDGPPLMPPIDVQLDFTLPSPPPQTASVWISSCGEGRELASTETTWSAGRCRPTPNGVFTVQAVARAADGTYLGYTEVRDQPLPSGQGLQVDLPPYSSDVFEHALELANPPTGMTGAELSIIRSTPYEVEVSRFTTPLVPDSTRLRLGFPPEDRASSILLFLLDDATLVWFPTIRAPTNAALPARFDLGGDFRRVSNLSFTPGRRPVLEWRYVGPGGADGVVANATGSGFSWDIVLRNPGARYAMPELPDALDACALDLQPGSVVSVSSFDWAPGGEGFEMPAVGGQGIFESFRRFSTASTLVE